VGQDLGSFDSASSAKRMATDCAARVPGRRGAVTALTAVPHSFAVAGIVVVAHTRVADEGVRVDIKPRLRNPRSEMSEYRR
jgi:hypothetical protein